jgi:putative ATP-dependent endonuclease of the OLD family
VRAIDPMRGSELASGAAMTIHKVSISNFRLLRDVSLLFDEKTTVIVGRNNSGKSSLTELFRRLLSEKKASFQLEDFSLSAHDEFWAAFLKQSQGEDEIAIRKALPKIEVRLTISYDTTDLGPLSEFVIDLTEDNTDALIVICYELGDGKIAPFFDGIKFRDDEPLQGKMEVFCRELKTRVPQHFSSNVRAVDPHDASNVKEMEWSKFHQLVGSGFINAQRGLDDITDKEKNVLGKILEALLDTAASEAAGTTDRSIAEQLDDAVKGIQESIDVGFNRQLEELLPAFALFGYPGLNDPNLCTETTLDVRRLLTNHTRVRYTGLNGIHLPEGYNGLGTRNLIFMLLKLFEFFKRFMASDVAPVAHLIFIEEPEVHLHPQMQEVFISTLGKVASDFVKKFDCKAPWPVQFVVTTHSSHVANRAPFDCVRYFLATPDHQPGQLRSTRIKNLCDGLSDYEKPDREFLHKYMTLTRCDLFFADKAILVEGPTERLLLPKMIEKIDAEKPAGSKLSSQYLSVIEIGGAYMHLFFDLLKFMEVRTLAITDLDTVNAKDNRKACTVSKGTHSSNAAIATWFNDPNITPAALLRKTAVDKTDKGIRRLAYQVPEADGMPCGRSFEAAFILANRDAFTLEDEEDACLEEAVWEAAKNVDKKTDFALTFAIANTAWFVPRYIAEGLRWLRDGVLEALPSATLTTSQTDQSAKHSLQGVDGDV